MTEDTSLREKALRDELAAHKAKSIARGKLLERFRCYLQEVVDHVSDEGDRVYFGSTNHFTYLKDIVNEMDMWNWDAIIRERPEIDPYEEMRALRLVADAKDRRIEALEAALTPFAECASEWDGEPDSLHVFLEWNDDKKPVPSLPVADFRRARAALSGKEGQS